MNAEDKAEEDKKEIIRLAEEKIDEVESKRETNKMVKDLKIITAISLGKDRNKELAKVLDTDKSFAAKKIKDLEQRGLVHKEGAGKKTRYRVDIFNVMKFLQSKVVITTKKKVKPKEAVITNAQPEEQDENAKGFVDRTIADGESATPDETQTKEKEVKDNGREKGDKAV